MATLKTRDAASILGTASGLALCVLLYLVFFWMRGSGVMLPVALVIAALVLVVYIVATVSVKSDSGTESVLTGACRGILVGFNSAANFGLLWWLLADYLGPAGLIVAVLLALLNGLACIGPVSRSAFYQCLLGWGNWLLPMSWLVVSLGLLFTLFSLLLHLAVTVPFGVDFTRVGINTGPLAGKRFSVDWGSGTLFLYGGLVANLNRLKTAFNMGNFAFVHYQSSAGHVQHEVGHTLNLAAFGSLFHFIGAVDEVLSGYRAFSEYMAESNDPVARVGLNMW